MTANAWSTSFQTIETVAADLSEHAFIDAVVLDDGTMICTEEYSHDLIHYDLSMKEIKRLPGTPVPNQFMAIVKNLLHDRRIIQPSIQGKILWPKSLHSLSVVDTHSFKDTEVNNFWTYSGKKCLSVFVTATNDLKRFAGIGMSPEEVETLHVYDIAGGTGFASASISKLFKSKSD